MKHRRNCGGNTEQNWAVPALAILASAADPKIRCSEYRNKAARALSLSLSTTHPNKSSLILRAT